MTPTPSTGVPATVGTTGQRGFYSDQTGVIRYTLTGAGSDGCQPGAVVGDLVQQLSKSKGKSNDFPFFLKKGGRSNE